MLKVSKGGRSRADFFLDTEGHLTVRLLTYSSSRTYAPVVASDRKTTAPVRLQYVKLETMRAECVMAVVTSHESPLEHVFVFLKAIVFF